MKEIFSELESFFLKIYEKGRGKKFNGKGIEFKLRENNKDHQNFIDI